MPVKGVMLQKHATEDKPVTFKGSMIIYTGASEEDVKNILREDIYARSGVWDLEKMKIISVCLPPAPSGFVLPFYFGLRKWFLIFV